MLKICLLALAIALPALAVEGGQASLVVIPPECPMSLCYLPVNYIVACTTDQRMCKIPRTGVQVTWEFSLAANFFIPVSGLVRDVIEFVVSFLGNFVADLVVFTNKIEITGNPGDFEPTINYIFNVKAYFAHMTFDQAQQELAGKPFAVLLSQLARRSGATPVFNSSEYPQFNPVIFVPNE